CHFPDPQVSNSPSSTSQPGIICLCSPSLSQNSSMSSGNLKIAVVPSLHPIKLMSWPDLYFTLCFFISSNRGFSDLFLLRVSAVKSAKIWIFFPPYVIFVLPLIFFHISSLSP
ncbi:unnamed protein product, partial [Staurois parvus]